MSNTSHTIKFKNDSTWLESYYQKLSGLFLVNGAVSSRGMILDLNSLPSSPVDFKKVFIKWMIDINAPRINQGAEPIMTLELALKCPIFKVIKPPLISLKLTGEGMFNKPQLKTDRQKMAPKGFK